MIAKQASVSLLAVDQVLIHSSGMNRLMLITQSSVNYLRRKRSNALETQEEALVLEGNNSTLYAG